jgi:hypothetical protein
MKNERIRFSQDSSVTEYDRTTSDILRITEDKLKLKLSKLKTSIESKNYLFVSLGIFISILITMTTSDFKDFILKKEIWESVFVLSGFVAFILIIINLIKSFSNKTDIESTINDIKGLK